MRIRESFRMELRQSAGYLVDKQTSGYHRLRCALWIGVVYVPEMPALKPTVPGPTMFSQKCRSFILGKRPESSIF